MTRSSFTFNIRSTNMSPKEWTRKKLDAPRYGYWAG